MHLAFALLLAAALCPTSFSSTCGQLQDKVRYCARLTYDGTGFKGWQDQAASGTSSRVRTVQGVVSDKVSLRFNSKIRVTGASRTDGNVHAKGQAVHFDLPYDIATTYNDIPYDVSNIYAMYNDIAAKNSARNRESLQKIQFSLNRILPDDVRIFNLSIAPAGEPDDVTNPVGDVMWHATRSATHKLYSYRFCTNEFVCPTRRRYVAHFYRPFDMALFKRSLEVFVGTHDFSAFTNRVDHTTAEFKDKGFDFNTVKRVNSVELLDEGGGYYCVNVNVESALYRMVRNIVGSSLLVAVDERFMSLTTLQRLLREAPGRAENPAGSAPPEGLCLEHVFYNNF